MNARDNLKYGHLTVLRTIEGLPEAEWETPGVCGVWSVREIIAHLASFEHVLVDVLASSLDGGPTPYLDRYTGESIHFNDSEVARRNNQGVGWGGHSGRREGRYRGGIGRSGIREAEILLSGRRLNDGPSRRSREGCGFGRG